MKNSEIITPDYFDTCQKCGSTMEPSKAIIPSVSGVSDFTGGEVVTMSEDDGTVLVDCLKCVECGWSVMR